MRLTLRPFPAALPAIMLLALGLAGCEEHLPAYELPEYKLSARVYIEPTRLVIVGQSPGIFGVDLVNASEGVDENVFPPPYELEADVSMWFEEDPSRRALISGHQLFDGAQYAIGPGEAVRLELEMPRYDDSGTPWDYGVGDGEDKIVVFQGSLRIVELDLLLNTPTIRSTFRFAPPGERPAAVPPTP